MEFDTIDWHFYVGYVVLSLIVFRVVWGVTGPVSARFSRLISSPRESLQYVQGVGTRQASGSPGHNPIGGLSVIAMLVSITFQAITGLFIESDDFFESAPLAGYVSDDTIGLLTSWHHLNAKVLLVLVALHLFAILFYLLWKKENLIKPMITGWKWVKSKNTDD